MDDNKVAVITGATSGIGSAVATKLALVGYTVVLVGRNAERGSSLELELKSKELKATFFQCDVSNEEQVHKLQDFLADSFEKVDVLFNNAGMMPQSKEIERISEEEWREVFDVNILGVFLVTKYLKGLICRCGGCIINNASIAGMQSYVVGRSYAYSASKSAVVQFSRQMALNYAREGIRVNCICPGIIDTPILGDRDKTEYANRIPLGYIGKPSDVANVVAFLASEQASYLTGIVLPIDGGASL